MRRSSVVAVFLVVLCVMALQPVMAGHLLTISNLQRYYDDGSGYGWHSQTFNEGGMRTGGGSFSQDYTEAYIDGDIFSNPSIGTVGEIYPPFPLTAGYGDFNTWPIRFNWRIESPVTPVYLVVYRGIYNYDYNTGQEYKNEELVWNSGPIRSYILKFGSFQTEYGTPHYFRIELTTTPVPEPASILIILCGVGALRLRWKN